MLLMQKAMENGEGELTSPTSPTTPKTPTTPSAPAAPPASTGSCLALFFSFIYLLFFVGLFPLSVCLQCLLFSHTPLAKLVLVSLIDTEVTLCSKTSFKYAYVFWLNLFSLTSLAFLCYLRNLACSVNPAAFKNVKEIKRNILVDQYLTKGQTTLEPTLEAETCLALDIVIELTCLEDSLRSVR
jgi:hypothetical protein